MSAAAPAERAADGAAAAPAARPWLPRRRRSAAPGGPGAVRGVRAVRAGAAVRAAVWRAAVCGRRVRAAGGGAGAGDAGSEAGSARRGLGAVRGVRWRSSRWRGRGRRGSGRRGHGWRGAPAGGPHRPRRSGRAPRRVRTGRTRRCGRCSSRCCPEAAARHCRGDDRRLPARRPALPEPRARRRRAHGGLPAAGTVPSLAEGASSAPTASGGTVIVSPPPALPATGRPRCLAYLAPRL